MPYVTQEQRSRLDPCINQMISVLREAPVERVDGELNYTVTRLLRSLYDQKYFDYNRAVGVLESVKLEFYRRWIASYEDKKMRERGDIPKR